ncbi:MAG: hypothetical protein COA88_04630 [Kordia sp.]|nr:MAG: hypothetical protein COA88_04630 [Kordia sp.]
MTIKKIITIILITTSLISYSQSFNTITITKKDNSQVELLGRFIYNSNNFIEKIITKKNATQVNYNINTIIQVQKKNETYIAKTINKKTYLLKQIIEGSLSLYKNKKDYFLENSEFELKKIPYNSKDGLTLNTFKYGVISLFINKCKPATEEAYRQGNSLSISDLKRIVTSYNSCDLSNDIIIPNTVIENINTPNDVVNFAISLSNFNLKTDFSTLSKNTTDNLNLFSVGAKIYFNTNILNKSLVFHFSSDYYFGKDKKINTSVYNKTSFLSTMVGVNYIFRSLNKTFKPYIGMKGGMYFNNKSYVIVKSNIAFLPNTIYKTNNELAYTFHAGTLISVFNQEIDFMINYQPKLDFNLRSSGLNQKTKSYTISGLNFKLSYLF